jgi:hypothetical protein
MIIICVSYRVELCAITHYFGFDVLVILTIIELVDPDAVSVCAMASYQFNREVVEEVQRNRILRLSFQMIDCPA